MQKHLIAAAGVWLASGAPAWSHTSLTSEKILKDAVQQSAQFMIEFHEHIKELPTLPPDIVPRLVATSTPHADHDAFDQGIRAHKTTWTTLLLLKQHAAVFSQAGKVKIADMPFWNENRAGSKSSRMAQQMDSVFVDVRGAERKVDNASVLLNRLLEQGRADEENLRWLADRIGSLYRFFGEN